MHKDVELVAKKSLGLIRIESTKNNPAALKEVIDFVAKMIEDSGKGYTIERFESNGRPSLLAYFGPTRPKKFKVILNGHADVVEGTPDMFKPTIADGKLSGRGAHDMKPAVVAMTHLFCEKADTLPFPLGLQIVSDEENGGKDGTLVQVNSGVRAEFVISAECGRKLDRFEIANEAKGIFWATLHFSGVKSHAAYAWRGQNALGQAADFIAKLHQAYPVPQQEDYVTTASATTITTDNQTQNSIPDKVSVGIDIRFMPGEKIGANKESALAFLQGLAPSADIHLDHLEPPLYSDPNSSFLKNLKRIAERVEGHEFEFVTRHATSDGRFYSLVGGQACEFGVAGEHQHGEDEHITLQSLSNFLITISEFLDVTAAESEQFANTKLAVVDQSRL